MTGQRKRLSSTQLLNVVLEAIEASGYKAIVLSGRKPFQVRVYQNQDGRYADVSVYIWNCTHGGGNARAEDEYRIQLTGVVPAIRMGQVTVLLGWHPEYEVFVAFDIDRHTGQASASPSIQIKQEALLAAHNNAFARYVRNTGEIAIAFKPAFFVDYVFNSVILHQTGTATKKDLDLLNSLDSIQESDLARIGNQQRRTIVAIITRKYRAYDFKQRVLGAYGHKCAFCGLQLELVEAAHIVPVADDSSTDETSNGVALCKIHHAAFDRNLVSINRKYEIELSNSQCRRLTESDRHAGLTEFRRHLRPAIFLPNDRRDYPAIHHIERARITRNWQN